MGKSDIVRLGLNTSGKFTVNYSPAKRVPTFRDLADFFCVHPEKPGQVPRNQREQNIH